MGKFVHCFEQIVTKTFAPDILLLDRPIERGDGRVFCNTMKLIGVAILALALGILLASILPSWLLVIILGLLVVLMGYLLFSF